MPHPRDKKRLSLTNVKITVLGMLTAKLLALELIYPMKKVPFLPCETFLDPK
jgi:hypothetical protein